MPVYELRAEVDRGAVEPLEELLSELEEQRLLVLEDKPAGRAWLAGYFESRASATEAWECLAGVVKGWIKVGPELHELPDADWKDSYKIHFKAWKFGRLNWVPVWERANFVLPPGEEVLWLDPGMAFGTGNHETTRLVVERLVAFAAQRGHGHRVIDAGCGSGILALSAAKLGFVAVTGFDHDPEAIRVSEENAALNGLAGRVEFFAGELVTGLEERQGELVLANIQADVLMDFADVLCVAVARGGELVLSGILASELDQVREKFASHVREWPVESRMLGEWADLVLTRPS